MTGNIILTNVPRTAPAKVNNIFIFGITIERQNMIATTKILNMKYLIH